MASPELENLRDRTLKARTEMFEAEKLQGAFLREAVYCQGDPAEKEARWFLSAKADQQLREKARVYNGLFEELKAALQKERSKN